MSHMREDPKSEGLDFKAVEENAREEEPVRPRVEIWPDLAYDEWAQWVRSHEMTKRGNPVDLCEMAPGMGASPLCPVGIH